MAQSLALLLYYIMPDNFLHLPYSSTVMVDRLLVRILMPMTQKRLQALGDSSRNGESRSQTSTPVASDCF